MGDDGPESFQTLSRRAMHTSPSGKAWDCRPKKDIWPAISLFADNSSDRRAVVRAGETEPSQGQEIAVRGVSGTSRGEGEPNAAIYAGKHETVTLLGLLPCATFICGGGIVRSQVRPGGYMSVHRRSPKESLQGLHLLDQHILPYVTSFEMMSQ